MSDPFEPNQVPAEPESSVPPSVRLPLAPASAPPLGHSSRPPPARPSFLFFGAVAAVSLVADVTSKAWAEIVLSKRTLIDPAIVLIRDHLSLTLAYNKGGAWGLLQNSSEVVRRPFFLLVSGLAIAFIISLYGRLVAGQRALKWGLPLVLGGALGNLIDRLHAAQVTDFIQVYYHQWSYPVFNLADCGITVGAILLIAFGLFTGKAATDVR